MCRIGQMNRIERIEKNKLQLNSSIRSCGARRNETRIRVANFSSAARQPDTVLSKTHLRRFRTEKQRGAEACRDCLRSGADCRCASRRLQKTKTKTSALSGRDTLPSADPEGLQAAPRPLYKWNQLPLTSGPKKSGLLSRLPSAQCLFRMLTPACSCPAVARNRSGRVQLFLLRWTR